MQATHYPAIIAADDRPASGTYAPGRTILAHLVRRQRSAAVCTSRAGPSGQGEHEEDRCTAMAMTVEALDVKIKWLGGVS